MLRVLLQDISMPKRCHQAMSGERKCRSATEAADGRIARQPSRCKEGDGAATMRLIYRRAAFPHAHADLSRRRRRKSLRRAGRRIAFDA